MTITMNNDKRIGTSPTDPAVHERIKNLQISTDATCDGMPMINDINIDEVVENAKKSNNLKQIDGIARLEDNWNDYNSTFIPKIVINKALELINFFVKQPDRVVPLAGGQGIQFEFDNGDNSLEIEILESEITIFTEVHNVSENRLNLIINGFYNV